MLSVSEAYSRAINADTRKTFHRVTIGGVTLDQTSVPKMTFDESVGGNAGVALGTSNSASLRLTLRNPVVIDYTEMLVEPESGIELPDGTIVWLPLGKFWVTDSSTSNDYKTVNLTCADGMYLMSGEYVSALTYPALVRDVAHEIAEQVGVELVDLEEWPEIYIRKKPEKLTHRNAIGYVAGCCGRNAKFNRYGKLELVWYKDTGMTIEREQQYLDGFTRLNDQPLNVDFEIKGEDEKYKVTIVSDDNGNVIATPGTNVLEGDTVTLSVVPFYGYELSVISANISNGESVALWQNADGDEYTFVQPDSDVTVTVTFKEKGTVGEVIVNPAVGGEYSFLQHPSFASPPTNKPYWAIFYKHDTDVGPNAKYYLVWFDSWSLGDKIYLSGERRGYYLNIDGYYYCRGANNGRAQHYWDNAVWQGNGASGSPLSWRTGVGRWCDDYGLLASNISLYDGDTLFFKNNESEIGTVQTSFLVNNVDVREKGVFSLYACPDTYSTPLPGKHWMLTNKARVYKTGTDGEYEDLFSGSSYDPYILFFDGCVIQDIGKYYDFHEGNYLKITFSKLVVASYLNYNTFYYSNERTFNEECYIIIGDPDYSSDYESGGGLEYPNGLYATNLSSSYFNNNSCMICDCVSVANEPTTFAMRRSVGATVTMEYTNPLITSKMVDGISAVVQGVSYTPSKVKHRGNPALEAGDIVTVPDRDGNYHTVLIMQQTLTFGGGMNAVITCPGQTEKKTNFSSTGALTTQIKQAVQEATSNQKRETDAYNSIVLSTLNRSMSLLSREVTEDSAEIKLLNEWRGTTSGSLAELSVKVDKNVANVESIVQWQGDACKRMASIEQSVDGIDLSVYAKSTEVDETYKGRNLLRDSRHIQLLSANTSVYPISGKLMNENGVEFYRYVRTTYDKSRGVMGVFNTIPVTQLTKILTGKEVTFSCWVRCSHATTTTSFATIVDTIDSEQEDFGVSTQTIPIGTTWTRFTATEFIDIEYEYDSRNIFRFCPNYINIPNNNVENFYLDIRDWKVEIGNEATEWSLAPEDLDETVGHLQQTVDGLELGGRNLLRNSRLIWMNSNNNAKYPISCTEMTENGVSFYRVKRTDTTNFPEPTISLYSVIPKTSFAYGEMIGKQVTLSFKARVSHEVQGGFMGVTYGGSSAVNFGKQRELYTTEWKTYYVVIDEFPDLTDRTGVRWNPDSLYLTADILDDFYLDIRDYKFEFGNMPSDWTPAPEEYSTTTEMESAIKLAVDSIDLSVYAKTSQLEEVEAQLSLAVLTDEDGNLTSAIHIGADKLTIDTDNFQLDGNGRIVAYAGEIGDLILSEGGLQFEEGTSYADASDFSSTTRRYYILKDDSGQFVFSQTYDSADSSMGELQFESNYTCRLLRRLSNVTQIVYWGGGDMSSYTEAIGIWSAEDGTSEAVFQKFYCNMDRDFNQVTIDTSDIIGDFFVGLFFSQNPQRELDIELTEKKAHLSKNGYEGCIIPRKVESSARLKAVYIDDFGRLCVLDE